MHAMLTCRNERERRNKYADERYGQSGVGMCHKKNDGTRKDQAADHKFLLTRHAVPRINIHILLHISFRLFL